MSELTIYGASDDLVEAEGIDGADEFGTSGNWTGVLEAPSGETALVYVDYRKSGTWTVALGQFEEDYALPAWPVAFAVDPKLCGYAVAARITVPDGTTLREVSNA